MPEDISSEDEETAFVLPDSVDATSVSPGGVEPSSTTQDGPLPVTDATQEAPEERPLPEFDPQYREAFEGLLYIGKVTRSFRWMGHSFVIHTPKVADLLEIGQIHAPYAGTVVDIKAYQSLMIAATLESIDGKPLPLPLGVDTGALQAKFEYIVQNWYPWTIDKLYQEYLLLDADVAAVYSALGKV